jgi:hypothetical protein
MLQRKGEKQQKLTLGPLLLLVRPAAPRGNKGAVNFFFLGGEGPGTADGSSSSGEEEETSTFF